MSVFSSERHYCLLGFEFHSLFVTEKHVKHYTMAGNGTLELPSQY